MTVRSRDPKGDRRVATPLQPLAVGPSRVERDESEYSSVGIERRMGAIGLTLGTMLQLSHGYFKASKNPLGSDTHLVYTWTAGKYSGCYVYVRVPWWQLDYGMDVLQRKVDAVDCGQLTPTWDKRKSDPA